MNPQALSPLRQPACRRFANSTCATWGWLHVMIRYQTHIVVAAGRRPPAVDG